MARSARSHLQRLPIVRAADLNVIVVELDAPTIARLDALAQRVREGDVPAALAKHMSIETDELEPSAT
jgi:hypothetical protein